jgi:L-ascorbate metabolism protein UlaG (beta-lactamase superfamily)
MIAIACLAGLGCQAQQQTDEFTTKSGKKVRITCIKHASMQINYNGLEIEVDPVGKGMKPETDYSKFPKADIILVTHEHHDHFDREALTILRTATTCTYTTQYIYNNNFHNSTPLNNGDSIIYRDDIKIEAVSAYNTTPGREQFHPKGRGNGYVLTLDGLRIYIAGDTEDIPEMANLKDIDIAFLPCNQPYTMTPEQLIKAARTIRPKVVFPYHYGQTDVGGIPSQLQGNGIEVRIRHYE